MVAVELVRKLVPTCVRNLKFSLLLGLIKSFNCITVQHVHTMNDNIKVLTAILLITVIDSGQGQNWQCRPNVM